jgi:hypothetical protein
MSEILTITYKEVPIGRVELWKECTDKVGENGLPIEVHFREPSKEDLEWAEVTGSGKIRVIHANVTLRIEPEAIQLHVISEQFHIADTSAALNSLLNLRTNVDREIFEKLREYKGLQSLPSQE